MRLEELLITSPIMILPVEGEIFVVYCDASHIGLAYVLMHQG